MTESDVEEATAMILALLADRAADATLCASEVARALAAECKAREWRTTMPVVHAAVDGLRNRGRSD